MNTNIVDFCAKSDIRKELTMVHVLERDGVKYAVATDSYKLLEWRIVDSFLIENIPCGYYFVKYWKEMCKAYNKKNKDITAFMQAVTVNTTINNLLDLTFPDYPKIIPSTTVPFSGTQKVNTDNMCIFLESITEKNAIDFSKIKQRETGDMLYFENDTLKVCLMTLSN